MYLSMKIMNETVLFIQNLYLSGVKCSHNLTNGSISPISPVASIHIKKSS